MQVSSISTKLAFTGKNWGKTFSICFINCFLFLCLVTFKTYCVKCRKDTNNINPKIFKTKNNKLLMQSTCSDCKNKKSRFVKEQDAKGLLSNLGINTPFSKIPLLNVLF